MIISIILKKEDCLSFFGSTFPEVKAAGKLPLGQLPVLEVLVAIVGIIDNHYHYGHHDQHHEPSQHDDHHRHCHWHCHPHQSYQIGGHPITKLSKSVTEVL